MRGTAYAIMNWKDVAAISLSLNNAQEILTDFALEAGCEVYNSLVDGYGHNFAMAQALLEMDHWTIRAFSLV